MSENQIARNRRLLELKGVPIEEEESQVQIDSVLLLDQYLKKKHSQGSNLGEWDDFSTEWNPDGTLNRIITYQNGEVFWRMDFAWNPDGSLNKIMRT